MVIVRRPVAGLSGAALSRFVSRAKRAVGLRGTVNVLVTSGRELKRLNQRFRGKNRATDVLSFPVRAGEMNGLAGEVAIAADIARQNAKCFRHSTKDEIKVLALHGILHLAGYDHERDQGEMARTEARLQKSLGLPTALIERNGELKSPRRGGRNHLVFGSRIAP